MVHSSLMTQILINLMVTYCSVVEVLALIGLTKKRFDHYAILKTVYLRSPSDSVLAFVFH